MAQQQQQRPIFDTIVAEVPGAFAWRLPQLPRELVELILKDLTPADHWALGRTCTRLRKICWDEKHWKSFSENIYVLAHKYWVARRRYASSNLYKMIDLKEEVNYVNMLAVLEAIAANPQKYHVATNFESCSMALAIAQDGSSQRRLPELVNVSQKCLGSVLGHAKDVQKVSQLHRQLLQKTDDIDAQLSMLQVIQHLVNEHITYCSPYDITVIKCVEVVYEIYEKRSAEIHSKQPIDSLIPSAIESVLSKEHRLVNELEGIMKHWEVQTEYGTRVGSLKLRQLLSRRIPDGYVPSSKRLQPKHSTPVVPQARWYNPFSWWK